MAFKRVTHSFVRSGRAVNWAGLVLTLLLLGCGQPALPATSTLPFSVTSTASASFEAAQTASPTYAPSPSPTAAMAAIHISDLQMVDDQVGWAVFGSADRDYIGRTTDGGETWSNVTPAEAHALRRGTGLMVSGVDARHAWVTPGLRDNPENCGSTDGYWPLAWHTDDGGSTWNLSNAGFPDTRPISIQGINGQTAFLVSIYTSTPGCGIVTRRTEDGGGTWKPLYPTHVDLEPPIFFDTRHGLTWATERWADMSEGHVEWIQTSADAGETWNWAPMPFPPADLAKAVWGDDPDIGLRWDFTSKFIQLSEQVIAFQVVYKMPEIQGKIGSVQISSNFGGTFKSLWKAGDSFFENSQTGWRLANPVTMALEQTNDGGRTWLPYPQPPEESWSIQRGLEPAFIVHTTESGANTTEIHPTFFEEVLWPGRGLRLESLHMADTTTGRALESGGQTVCTTDGARTWLVCQQQEQAPTPEYSQADTGSDVISQDFIDDQVGWRQLDLQNGYYKIQQTHNGGSTWENISTTAWLADLNFVNEQEGWTIARQAPDQGLSSSRPETLRIALLMHTTNGGRTWSIMLPVMAQAPISLENADRVAKLRFLETGELLKQVAFVPTGGLLATLSNESIQFWDLATDTATRRLVIQSVAPRAMTFSSDGKRVAAGWSNGNISLYNTANGSALRALHLPSELQAYTPLSLAFSSDGTMLASGLIYSHYEEEGIWGAGFYNDGGLAMWDASSGRVLNTWGDLFPIVSVAISTDGNQLVAGSTGMGVGDELLLMDMTSPNDPPVSLGSGAFNLSLSPDGRILAADSGDNIVIWDAVNWTKLNVLQGHNDRVTSIAFSPDGSLLASASEDATIKLWNVVTGKLLSTLREPAWNELYFATSLSFSPDGTLLAAGTSNSQVFLWSVQH